MKKQLILKAILLMTILATLVSCGGHTLPPTPTVATSQWITQQPTATQFPTSTAVSLGALLATPSAASPQVMDTKPDRGEEARLDAVIEVGFDQPMDVSSVQAVWQVNGPEGSPINGQFAWPAPDRLRFTPSQPLQPASSYTVSVGEKAASREGAQMAQPFTFRFNTFAPVQVSQVFPADGTVDVDVTNRITLMFNRPMVALSVKEDQKDQPQPLDFSPEVGGNGEWINTSVYVFTPTQALRTNTTYTLRVAAGLKDATADPNSAMPQVFLSKFTTRAAQIWQIEADGQIFDPLSLSTGYNLSLIPKITLRFQQPMDPVSTNAAITLSDEANKLPALHFQWAGDHQSVLVAPLVVLPMGSGFALKVSTAAKTVDGSSLGRPLAWNFITIPAPKVDYTSPSDGTNASHAAELTIHFVSPMNPKTIAERVVFDPPLKGTQNYYYNGSENTAVFYGLEPSTSYAVTLLPGMTDIYGNAINTTRVVRFSTAPITPWANLNMPYNPVFTLGGSQDFYFRSTNVGQLDFKLYKVAVKDFIQYTQSGKGAAPESFHPQDGDLVANYSVQPDALLNKTVTDSLPLQDKDGKSLQPGFYFLTLNSPKITHEGLFVDQRFLAVTGTHLTLKNSPSDALIWATDPRSGKPQAGLALKVYDPDDHVLAEGKTDADGLLHLEIAPPTDPNQGFPPRVVVSENPAAFAYISSNWDSGFDPWAFGINQGYFNYPGQTLVYVYTERPLYRPGQPVYFKGILRTDNDLDYSLPKEKEIEIVIRSYDQEVYRQKLPISDYGAFNGQLNLDPEAALGAYTLEVHYPGKDSVLGSIDFTVAEYRKPEFQVELSASPANLLAGDKINAQLNAAYYSGGGVKGAEVAWTLRADPFYFNVPGDLSAYSFYDDSRDSGLEGLRQTGERSKIVAEGKALTGEDGSLTFTVPTNVQNSSGAQRLTLEATVTDFAGNAVSAQAQVTAHHSAVYVGIRPTQYVGQTGEEQSFELVAVDWDGKPQANQRLDVAISERQWYNVQEQDPQGVLRWVSSVKDIPVTSFSGVMSDEQGRAVVKFTPTRGGVYRALAKGYDRAGNPSRSAAYLWVAGPEYIPWRQANDRTFQLVLDKDAYKPGDTTEILIASPFQGSTYALLTVERGRVRHEEVLKLSGNSTVYRLPVTADMAPVVYVSVEVIKGVDDTNPRPAFKVGIAKLKVSTEQQALKVEVTPDRPNAGPGEQVIFAVKTSSSDGKPAPAEVSLGLSDLATLSLMPPNSPPILDYFYAERGLSVRTGVTITASMDDFNTVIKEDLARGEHAGGGGKGDGSLGVPAVRQNFPDTAFWKADLRTDKDGKAQVSVTLPDNLTTWRMDARGVTLDTHAGQSTVDIVSSRPLLVRPQTPRFFVAGDQAVLGAAVHNNTGKDLSLEVTLEAQGVKLEDKPTQMVNLKGGQQILVQWKVSVPEDSTRADLIFSAKGGSYSDASRPTLGTLDKQGIPVYRYEAPETVGTSGELNSAGTRTEMIRLPQEFKVTQADLTVKIEPSLAAGMTAGLTYLEHYPYECTEQTVSRFLPNVITMRALQTAGISDPQLEKALQQEVSTGLQRLYQRQNSDGGWGWWNGNSDVLTSAYVILGLVEAQKADYSVDKDVLEKGLSYLRPHASIPADLEDKGTRNLQSFVLYVLSHAGDSPTAQAVTLYERRNWLDLYGKAFLAQTLYAIDPKDQRLDTLRADLISAAILSATGAHWEEKGADKWNWNTDTRTTAIILDTLTVIDAHNPITANAVRWLMSTRSDGHWKTTQETAWTLMALTDWMVSSGELNGDYAYRVQLNGKDIGQGQVNKGNLQQPQTLQVQVKDLLTDASNRLVIARDGQAGTLYYTTHLSVSLPVSQIKALDQGIILSRRYFALDDLKTPVTQAYPGQILQVQLTILAPHHLNYVLITDPLPAGLEAIDTSLKSSPTNEIPQDYDWNKVGEEGWGCWYFPHVELRDEKVALSADYLPRGTYTYTYRVRATTSGTFQVIPPTAQEFYFPEVYGRGDGSIFTVVP